MSCLMSDGDTLPLSQPQSAHGTLVGGSSCPGTPEMRRRQEEALRRLASQVPTHPNQPSIPLYLLSFIHDRCFFFLISLIHEFTPALVISHSLSLLFPYSFKHKGLLRLCCLIKYLYPQSLPAQPLDILSAPHG